MDVRGEGRVQRGLIVAAISGACLAVMSAGCSGAPTPAAPPAATPALTATAGVITTPATTITSPGAVAGVDTQIKVFGNCTTPSIEPAEIVLACADYGALLEGLRWARWTAASATAVGTLVYNDCMPSCAEGHHRRVTGTRVTLTVPVHGAGAQLVWSQIQESPQPPGYKTGPYHGGPQPLPIRPS